MTRHPLPSCCGNISLTTNGLYVLGVFTENCIMACYFLIMFCCIFFIYLFILFSSACARDFPRSGGEVHLFQTERDKEECLLNPVS
jgi:hypothetical protein